MHCCYTIDKWMFLRPTKCSFLLHLSNWFNQVLNDLMKSDHFQCCNCEIHWHCKDVEHWFQTRFLAKLCSGPPGIEFETLDVEVFSGKCLCCTLFSAARCLLKPWRSSASQTIVSLQRLQKSQMLPLWRRQGKCEYVLSRCYMRDKSALCSHLLSLIPLQSRGTCFSWDHA